MKTLKTAIATILIAASILFVNPTSAGVEPGLKISKVSPDASLWIVTFESGFVGTVDRTVTKRTDDPTVGKVTSLESYRACFFCASGYKVVQGKNTFVVYAK